MSTPGILTVTLFFTRRDFWRAEIGVGHDWQPLTDWLPSRAHAEAEAKLWIDMTIGPGHEIAFEVVRDLRHQE